MSYLLHLPHHDGSALYVDNPHPALGDTVTLRVRVPKTYPLQAMHVRSIRDGEPEIVAATVECEDAHERWWQVQLVMMNPVTNYRFLLDGGRDRYAWLNASGVYDHDLTDAHDFWLTTFDPAPDWATDAIVYEVFLDRFARSGAARELPEWAVARDWYDDPVVADGVESCNHVYGGDLAGIEAHLDHIVSLGCTAVYLTPFFEATSNHRYNASSFDEVDPFLGGDAALASLTAAAHDRGLRVLGDLTTNHTGDDHTWFRKGAADPTSADAAMYYWQEPPENPEKYVSWLGVSSLPKLNWSSPELRQRMIEGPESVTAKWLQEPYSLDGWRVDVVNMTGRHKGDDFNRDVGRTMRHTMKSVNPDTLLVAEHGHDYAKDVVGDSWHSVMNYAGFLRPMWQWLVARDTPVEDFLGVPVRVPPQDAKRMVTTMRGVAASVPWQVTTTNLNLVASHDTARMRSITGDPAAVAVAAGILFTFPGIPMVFAGDEIGLAGINGEDSRRPFPWERPDTWDTDVLRVYRALASLRNSHAALRRGGMRWAFIDDDAIVYLRETAEERLLISASRTPGAAILLPADELGVVDGATLLYGDAPAMVEGGVVTLSRPAPSVSIWSLH
jgi:alpha-glucosidase